MLKGLYSQEIQEKKKIYKIKPQTIKKMAIGTYISIITLNVNGLNAPTKRLAEWIQKPIYIWVIYIGPIYMLYTRHPLRT